MKLMRLSNGSTILTMVWLILPFIISMLSDHLQISIHSLEICSSHLGRCFGDSVLMRDMTKLYYINGCKTHFTRWFYEVELGLTSLTL